MTLAVHPSYQNQGIGKYLLVEGLRRLKAKGAKKIKIDVVSSNKNALKLYQKCGFNKIDKKTVIIFEITRNSMRL